MSHDSCDIRVCWSFVKCCNAAHLQENDFCMPYPRFIILLLHLFWAGAGSDQSVRSCVDLGGAWSFNGLKNMYICVVLLWLLERHDVWLECGIDHVRRDQLQYS